MTIRHPHNALHSPRDRHFAPPHQCPKFNFSYHLWRLKISFFSLDFFRLFWSIDKYTFSCTYLFVRYFCDIFCLFAGSSTFPSDLTGHISHARPSQEDLRTTEAARFDGSNKEEEGWWWTDLAQETKHKRMKCGREFSCSLLELQ